MGHRTQAQREGVGRLDLRAPVLAVLAWAGAMAAAGWWWGALVLAVGMAGLAGAAGVFAGTAVLGAGGRGPGERGGREQGGREPGARGWGVGPARVATAEHAGRPGRDVVLVLAAGLVLGAAVYSSAAIRGVSDATTPLRDLAERRSAVVADLRVLRDPRTVGDAVVLEGAMVQWQQGERVWRGRTAVVVWGDDAWRRVGVGEVWRTRGRLALREGTVWWSPHGTPQRVRAAGPAWRAAAAVRRGVRSAARAPAPTAAGNGPGAPPVAPPPIHSGAALVPALVDGDDASLAQGVIEDFRTSGLTHLLAVSGTNLTVLLVFVVAVARGVGVRGRWLVLVGLLAVVGFVLLARGEPSVLRAAVMGSVGVLALGQRAPGRAVAVLSTCVVLLLLVSPGLGVTAGFGLSVCATAGIVVLAPPWSDLLLPQVARLPGGQWLAGWLPAAVVVPLAAQIVCTPLVLAISGEVSLVAVVANLAAAPVVGPVTVLGLLGGVVSLVWEFAGQVLSAPAVWGATWIVLVADRAAGLPGASVAVGTGPVVWTVAALVCAALCLAVPRVLARARWILVCVVVLWLPVPHPGWPPAGWRVAMCDVGQGDAVLLRAGERSAVMVDTGPDPRLARRCLRRFGIEQVPLLLLTHHDADHVGGVAGVMDRVSAVEVSSLDQPPAGAALVVATARGRAPLTRAGLGTRRYGQVSVQVVSVGEGAVDPNDSSVVALASVGGLQVLLTGDLGRDAQQAVRRVVGRTRVDVLKVPHHGSRDTDLAWLRSLHPGIALIGVGAENTYGHPAREVLAALQGARVGRTDRHGDLAVVPDDDAWSLVHR